MKKSKSVRQDWVKRQRRGHKYGNRENKSEAHECLIYGARVRAKTKEQQQPAIKESSGAASAGRKQKEKTSMCLCFPAKPQIESDYYESVASTLGAR